MKLLHSLLLICLSVYAGSAHAEPVRLAAAANLKFAIEEVAANYTKETGHQIMTTFGSSALLSTQIKHGAPFQLFMSADEAYVADLHSGGYTLDEGVIYAYGRIVLVAPKNSKLKLDNQLQGLAEAIKEQKLNRFAIANPQHAPYGRLAEQTLRHLGLWQPIQPYLVFGENVSQAAQFATSGSTDGGIVAFSLVKSPQLESQVNYVLLPETFHQPLKQRMALTKNAGPVAKDFYRYIQKPAARTVFKRYGFDFPETAR